ncbi:MAG: alkyl hydroperoxide reductase, partial [Anaerolineaceae bacterium]|nr:alkyl hydroperoxide reductase [Anaerolineaceae bacterium]
MAQLRQDYQEFVNRQAVLLVLGPENADAFKNYFEKNDLPF